MNAVRFGAVTPSLRINPNVEVKDPLFEFTEIIGMVLTPTVLPEGVVEILKAFLALELQT